MILDRLGQNNNQTDRGKMNHMIWTKKSAERFIAFYQLTKIDTERTLEIMELRSCINIVATFVNGEKPVKLDLFIKELDRTQMQDEGRIIGKRYDSIKSF